MSDVVRVALLGFSAFERSAMASYLRLAARRQPSYELVDALDLARLVIVDGDSGAALRQLYLAHREADALAIGAMKPPAVAMHLKRPIDPLHVLRDLDLMLGQQTRQSHAFDITEPAAFRGLIDPSSRISAPGDKRIGADSGAGALAAGVEPESVDMELPLDDGLPTLSEVVDLSPPFPTIAPDIDAAPPPPSAPAVVPQSNTTPNPEKRSRRRRRGNAMSSKAVGRHALLVNSDEVAALKLESQLSRFGVSTAIAHSADAALRHAAEGGFDFVFINLSIDGPSDGIALCRQLRHQARPPGEMGPLLVMQAAPSGQTLRVQATMAGADAFLSQPVGDGALQNLMAAHGVKPLSGPAEPA